MKPASSVLKKNAHQHFHIYPLSRAVCTCFVPAVKPSHASVCTDLSQLSRLVAPFVISSFGTGRRIPLKLQKRVVLLKMTMK